MKNPNCPTKKGQKFIATETELTVKSFYGADGIEFDTYQKARNHNKSGHICVKNEEYGGASHEDWCVLIK